MIQPREFPNLVVSPYLPSDLVEDHLDLYRKAVAELSTLQDAQSRVLSGGALGLYGLTDHQRRLLDYRVCDMGLSAAWNGPILGIVDTLTGELNARGITFVPKLVPGEDEFFVRTGTTAINAPWYLFTSELWDLVNGRHLKYTPAEVLRVLRHEAGHALGYAFEVYKRRDWARAFGDFEQEYLQAYTPDPGSPDYVKHLHRSGPWQNSHYAQKHPDEDWAETFACWLTPGLDWRSDYPEGTPARAKLDYVDALVNRDGALYGDPPVIGRGPVSDWRSLDYTVGEFLEVDAAGGFDDHLAMARRYPEVYASVVLHEKYFEQFGGAPTSPGSTLAEAAVDSYGSFDAWAADLRALCLGSTGWVVTAFDNWGKLRNFVVTGHSAGLPADAPVILAVDCWEHAYAADYGTRKDVYLAAWWRSMDWAVIETRLGAGR